VALRNYSSTAAQTSLSSGISSAATSMTVSSVTGYPTAPFVVILDLDQPTEEAVLVGSVVGLSMSSCTRGYDSTSAVAHDAGATVNHAFIALDAREANEHVNADTPTALNPIHGVESDFVGINDTQILDNKTFQNDDGADPAIIVQGATGQSVKMLVFEDSGSNDNGGVYPTGRIESPGIDGNDTSSFEAGSAATNAVVVKAAGSQTAKLVSVTDSSDVEMASIGPAGRVGTPGVDGTNSSTFVAGAAATVPLTTKGTTSQTADLLQAQSTAGTVLAKVTAAGVVSGTGLAATSGGATVTGDVAVTGGVSATGTVHGATVTGTTMTATGTVTGATVASTGQVTAATGLDIDGASILTASTAGQIPLTVQEATSQTADIQRWVTRTGTRLAYVDNAGAGVFPNLPARVTSGSTSTTTNVNGDAQVNTGLTSITMFVAWNGDTSVPNIVMGNNRGLWPSTSGGLVGVRCFVGSTGSPWASHSVRIDWIAIGS